jgi:hypothetical protein
VGGVALAFVVANLRVTAVLADIGSGATVESTEVRVWAQVAWIVGVCGVALVAGLVVFRLVSSRPSRLRLAAAALIVLTYPIIWAFGYQDHRWHHHMAANVVAMLATVAAAVVFSLGERADPPVSRAWTATAVVVTVTSVGVARFWDMLWEPGSDVIGGAGVLFVPLAWTGLAGAVSWVVVAAVRRRTSEKPSFEHA